MATADSDNHVPLSVPDEIVVDLPYEDLVLDLLRDLGLRREVKASSKVLELSRIGVSALDGAAARLRQEADEIAASPGSEPWRAAFPRPTDQSSPLDLLLYNIRFRTARENAGWTFEMGKNRHVRSVIGLPHYSGGGVLYPEPAYAPTPRPGEPARGTCLVGLLDTRITPHPVLVGKLHAAEGAVLDGTGPFSHYAGHATFVAGRILAEAPEARLVVGSVLDDGHAIATAWGTALEMMKFRDSGVKILNLSLGCITADGDAPLIIARAVELLTPQMVIIAAAGNHGDPKLNNGAADERAACWPAALSQVEAVGAVTEAGDRAEFSPDVRWTTFMAPGQNVVGPFLTGTVNVQTRENGTLPTEFPDGWASWSGTSFATATVTGRLARLTARNGGDPHAALRELRRTLRQAGGSDPIRLAH
jgi:subtilisin family serine protease